MGKGRDLAKRRNRQLPNPPLNQVLKLTRAGRLFHIHLGRVGVCPRVGTPSDEACTVHLSRFIAFYLDSTHRRLLLNASLVWSGIARRPLSTPLRSLPLLIFAPRSLLCLVSSAPISASFAFSFLVFGLASPFCVALALGVALASLPACIVPIGLSGAACS